MVGKYRNEIFTKLEIPAERIVGREDRQKRWRAPYQRKNSETVGKIEVEAFSDGYYLAMGFANGSCKSAFYHDKDCSTLIPGEAFRMRLRVGPQ